MKKKVQVKFLSDIHFMKDIKKLALYIAVDTLYCCLLLNFFAMLFDFKKNREWATHLQIVLQLGLTMVGCIVFCFFIGRFLDTWLGTKGLMMAIFTIFGVIGGGFTAYRQILETLDSEKQDSDNRR